MTALDNFTVFVEHTGPVVLVDHWYNTMVRQRSFPMVPCIQTEPSATHWTQKLPVCAYCGKRRQNFGKCPECGARE